MIEIHVRGNQFLEQIMAVLEHSTDIPLNEYAMNDITFERIKLK